MSQTLGRARGVMSGFTPGQRGVVLVAGLALVLGAVALTRWISQPSWAPLFGNLSGTDASAITEQLQASGVKYQLTDGGGTVLVPQSQVYDLRVQMSGKGLPTGGDSGYSLLDKQGITATDFQQNVAYRRALEGELNKTLEAIDGVRAAVVHLALPKKDVFTTEQDTATGSVLLSLMPGTTLDRTQVRAITHLVAGSVEGLDPEKVTVTDSTGRLLSVPGDGVDGSAAAAGEADDQTAQFEDRMTSSVQAMLDRVLGAGHSTARVNAVLNFDNKDTTSETYVSATGLLPLSEETTKETYAGGAGSAGGALGQTFPTLGAVSGGSGAGSYDRQQRTVNNPVGKVVERNQASPGQVQRMTVAVAIDAGTAGSADPNQIQQLIANAVGLDPKRGDSVQVDKLPFDTAAVKQAQQELTKAESAQKQAQYIDLGKKAGIVLAILVIGFLLLRRGSKGGGPSVEATATDLPGGGLLMPPGTAPALGPGTRTLAALPSGEYAGGGGMIGQDQIRDHVSALVENQPDEVAHMLQGWLSETKA